MDYRAAVAAIRSERDREIERVRAEAARRLEDARVERDAEIHRLAAAGMTRGQIAAAVGYSAGQVLRIASGKREDTTFGGSSTGVGAAAGFGLSRPARCAVPRDFCHRDPWRERRLCSHRKAGPAVVAHPDPMAPR